MRIIILTMTVLFGLTTFAQVEKQSAPLAPPELSSPGERLAFFIQSDNSEGVRAALDEGADVNAEYVKRVTPLQLAVIANSSGAFAVLLERGADVTLINNEPIDALGYAVIHDRPEMMEALLRAGAKPGQKVPERYNLRQNAFALAVLYGKLEWVKRFVAMGVDPRDTHSVVFKQSRYLYDYQRAGSVEQPILSLAARSGSLETVRFLVEECGVPVNTTVIGNECDALWTAVKYGCTDIVRYLIAQGADVNALSVDTRGKFLTYLYYPVSCLAAAANYGHLEIVKMLMNAGARIQALPPSPSRKDIKLYPPYLADRMGHDAMVDYFAQLGHSSHLWDYWQQTAAADYEASLLKSRTGRSTLAAVMLEGAWPADTNAVPPVAEGDKIRLGILADDASQTLADLLTVEVSQLNHVELMERNRLDTLIAERKLNLSGLVAGKGLNNLANLLDAHMLVLVRELEVGDKQLHEVRLVDVYSGIVRDLRFVPGDAGEQVAIAEQYARQVLQQVDILRSAQNLLPVVLTNVRADRSGVNAEQRERVFRHALEGLLSRQDGLLVLERGGLRDLQFEKAVSGQDNRFAASAVFIDARIDLQPEADTNVLRLVCRVERAGQDPRIITLENTFLSEGDLLKAAVSQILNELERQGSTPKASLEVDARHLAREGDWLKGVGLLSDSVEAYQNALALDPDAIEIRMGYLSVISSYLEALDKQPRTHAATEKRLIEMQIEYLDAVDAQLRLADGMDNEREKNRAYESVFQSFDAFTQLHTRYRSFSMREHFFDGIANVEARYLRLIRNRILPYYIVTENSSEQHLPPGVSMRLGPDSLGRLPYLYTRNKEEVFSLLSSYLTNLHNLRKKHGEYALFYYKSGVPLFNRTSPHLPGPELVEIMFNSNFHARAYAQLLNVAEGGSGGRTPPLVQSISSQLMLFKVFARRVETLSPHEKMVFRANAKLGYDLHVSDHEPVRQRFLEPLTYPQSFHYRPPDLTMAKMKHNVWMADNGASHKPFSAMANQIEHLYTPEQIQAVLEIYPNIAIEDNSHESTRNELVRRMAYFEENLTPSVNAPALSCQTWHPATSGVRGDWKNFIIFHSPVFYNGRWVFLGGNFDTDDWREKSSKCYLFEVDPQNGDTRARQFNFIETGKSFSLGAPSLVGDYLLFDRSRRWLRLNLNTLKYAYSKGNYRILSQQGHGYGGKFYSIAVTDEIHQKYDNVFDRSGFALFLEYDPATDDYNVIANARRNPPQNPMDHQSRSSYARQVQRLLGKDGLFVDYGDTAFRYFPETGAISLVSPPNTHPRQIYPGGYAKGIPVGESTWYQMSIRDKNRGYIPQGSFARMHLRENKQRGEQRDVLIEVKLSSESNHYPAYENYRKSIDTDNDGLGFGFAGEYAWVAGSGTDPITYERSLVFAFFKTEELLKVLHKAPDFEKAINVK